MLERLRWKLTFMYIGASLTLMLLIGGGSYYVLESYFKTEVDLALSYGMVGQFQLFGVDLPESLQEAETEWIAQQPGFSQSIFQQAVLSDDDDEEEGEYEESYLHELEEHGYETQLISIFIMPLDSSGNVIFNPNPFSLPMSPDLDAFQAAMDKGSDFRTVSLPNGQRIRLLTYRTGNQTDPVAFQLGRSLIEQDQVLRQLLFGIFIIGSISLVLVGLGSWQLAGRALLPAQKGMDQQRAFIANASHELRTPLTLIRASAEMATRKNKADALDELLQNVIEESDYMTRLVDDLLLLTRLDAKQINLDIQPIDISALINEVAQLAERLADHKEIGVQVGQIKKTLHGDITRIRQVLLIILDNAITHTADGGKILISAREYKEEVVIEIQDNGRGISPEHLPRIFDRFYQVETNVNQRSNGLGLSIAKNLIELHQGQIAAKSVVGEGATITIKLPVA